MLWVFTNVATAWRIVVYVVVEPSPQALLLEGLDPALGAAVALRLAHVGGVIGDAQPTQGAEEVGRAVLRPPVLAQAETSDDVGSQLAPPVDHCVMDWLEGGVAVTGGIDMGPGLGGVVVDTAEHPTQPSSRVKAMVPSAPQRRLGPAGTMVPSCGRGVRRRRARCGASRPARRMRRSTRLPLVWMPCSRRRRARTLR